MGIRPGLPANAVHVKAGAFVRIDAAAAAFARKGTAGLDVASWNTAERVRYPQSPATQAELQSSWRHCHELLNLANQRNSEVRFAWLRLAIANRYPPGGSAGRGIPAVDGPAQVRAAAVQRA